MDSGTVLFLAVKRPSVYSESKYIKNIILLFTGFTGTSLSGSYLTTCPLETGGHVSAGPQSTVQTGAGDFPTVFKSHMTNVTKERNVL